jgi:hypothetical protein
MFDALPLLLLLLFAGIRFPLPGEISLVLIGVVGIILTPVEFKKEMYSSLLIMTMTPACVR